MDLVAEKFPKNVAAAVDRLIEQFSNREQVKIANMSQNALVQFHRSLENYIVTEFRLPGNDPLMQSCGYLAQLRELNNHQASYIILQAMQLRLQETTFLKVIK